MPKKRTDRKLICFDLDDTLILGDKAHIAAYNQAFKKFGLKEQPARILKKHFGILSSVFVREIFPFLTDKEVSNIIAEHRRILVRKTKYYAKPVKGALEVLRLLKKKYKIGLVTNCKHATASALLSATGFPRKLFDVIITNTPKMHPKPSPDELFRAQHLLHHNVNYMVGDTIWDIIAAKQAGAKAIAVLTGNTSKYTLSKYKPWKIIKSVKDLPKIMP